MVPLFILLFVILPFVIEFSAAATFGIKTTPVEKLEDVLKSPVEYIGHILHIYHPNTDMCYIATLPISLFSGYYLNINGRLYRIWRFSKQEKIVKNKLKELKNQGLWKT